MLAVFIISCVCIFIVILIYQYYITTKPSVSTFAEDFTLDRVPQLIGSAGQNGDFDHETGEFIGKVDKALFMPDHDVLIGPESYSDDFVYVAPDIKQVQTMDPMRKFVAEMEKLRNSKS